MTQIEKKEKNETRFRVHLQSATLKSPTCAQRYDRVLHRPYQTRPEAKFCNLGTFIHEAKNKSSSDSVPLRADPDPHQIRLLGPTYLPPKDFFVWGNIR